MLLVAGFLGGILASTIGIGGGIIFVVVIPWALTSLNILPADQAPFIVANSMLATGFSAISANLSLWRQGKVFPKPVLTISAVALAVSIAVLFGIVRQPWYSGILFNAVLIVLLLLMLWRTLFFKEQEDASRHPNTLSLADYVKVGGLTGIIQPLSGLGGGIIMIPVLNTWYQVPIKLAGNVSLGVVGLVSLLNAANMMFSEVNLPTLPHTGYIIWSVALALSAGVIAGAPIGVRLARILSPNQIRWLFIGFMSITLGNKVMELVTLLVKP